MATLVLSTAASDDDARQRADGNFFKATAIWMFVNSAGVEAATLISGMRFDGVVIDPGDTIDAATFAVTTSTDDDANCDIHTHANADSPNFTSNASIVNRSPSSASTAWVQDGLGSSTLITSPDFAAAMQEYIDLVGFASGQAVMVIVKGWFGGAIKSLDFASWDHVTLDPPELTVDFTAAASGVAPHRHHYEQQRK